MDVADTNVGQLHVRDEIALRSQKLFQDFLEEFKEDGEIKYTELVQEMINPDKTIFDVSFEDVEKYNQNLAQTIIEEYYRVYPFLCQAAKNFIKDHTRDEWKDKDILVGLLDVPTRHKVRELTTTKIGTLVRICGQVVRTHPVHPELIAGTFLCLDCQTITRDVEQQFKFTMPTICRNPVCNNRRRFVLEVDQSRFVDFQKVRIQETQSELPRGSIPRSLEIILRGNIVETVQAGDRYDFTGTLIVVPDVGVLSMPGAKAELGSRHKAGEDVEGVRGLKALGVRDLNYRLAFLACSAQSTSLRYGGTDLAACDDTSMESLRKQMTAAEWNRVYEMSRDKNIYQNLVNSLFPSIHGNDEVKRGILLMLFGGVSKVTEEGTSLRGDINCCIVGDPSTAKSQFLKQISEIAPRAVYTSGKASTAAGLTAAVVKDEESYDFVIEAGALMLADNGICCIDEFDKMDPKDQVAIHEAMEQQTISLAKAGVRATLNARTSILAAANPIGGRYDRAKSLQQNIMLSAPIMSRFDLFFILVDECNEVVDYAIARKIVDLHSNIEDTVEQIYTQDEILRFLLFAKKFKPVLTEEAAELLVEQYNFLRQRDGSSTAKSTWRITVRQLESMIRLSEAMAKVECADFIQVRHVKEAFRLLNKSIIRVEQPDIHLDDEDNDQDFDMDQTEETTNGTVTNGVNGTNGHHNGDTPAPTKKKLKLTFEEYKNLTNTLVVYMRNEEQRAESETSNERSSGVRKSEVISWYLNLIEEQIDSEDELIERRNMVEKVIERLIYHDQIIIPLITTGLKGVEEKEDGADPLLVVHPNYVVDS